MHRWPILTLLLISTLAAAQDRPKVYETMGAPPDPKVPAQWNKYHHTREVGPLLQALVKAHPKNAKLQSLGKSYGGNDMWVMTITNFSKGKELEKPAMWIDGGIHANEIQATEVTLYTAWYLLEMYARNEFVKGLVDDRVFYILPMMSPDSRAAHFDKPNTTNSPRSGQRPFDDDLDGLVDEDGPDDLDGDGHITQMRVRDPNGRWKTHPDFPNVMVPVQPGEKGEFTLLGMEGYDNDGDGEVNEDNDGRYDPNRDWPWNWQPRPIQNGAHRYPFSLLENRMMADFVLAHPNIAAAQSFHNAGGMILRGPGVQTDRYEPSDIAVYDLIGRKGEQLLPAYRYMNVAYELYETYGGEIDWFHQMLGVYSFTNELFTPFNYFRKSQEEAAEAAPAGAQGRGGQGRRGGGAAGGGGAGGGAGSGSGPVSQARGGRDQSRQDEPSMFNKYLLFDQATVAWHKAKHPQFGDIEIGGLKKNFGRQPPSFLLEEECHRNMAFSFFHADQMPKVKVLGVDRKRLGGDLWQITATVANEKPTPTHSSTDVINKITPPDTIALKAEGITVILGMSSQDMLFRSMTEQKLEPQTMKLANLPGESVTYVRWLVKGPVTGSVEVRSVKGGTFSFTIK